MIQQELNFRKKGYRTEYITEPYVTSPPALFILDEQGNSFTLGFRYQERRNRPSGHYAFNVLFNGAETGEWASHIEKRGDRVSIFTREGRKVWNGTSFT